MLKNLRIFIILILTCTMILMVIGCRDSNAPISQSKQTTQQDDVSVNPEFKELNLQKDILNIKFEGKSIDLRYPVYIDNNRYFIPISTIISEMGGHFTRDENKITITINDKNVVLNINNSTYNIGNNITPLKEKPLLAGNIVYVTMFDLTLILNLKTDWDFGNKTISFFNQRENIDPISQIKGKTAFIRLEDISVEQSYNTAESLEKLRIIADYLYSNSIPFHVAWVPRYVDPPNKIDNDPSTTNSIYDADFIFTLDYFTARNAIIGLHGYTHQHGQEKSIEGVEFNGNVNADEKSTRDRVEMAIKAAQKLDIPVSFFESPHYAATAFQRMIISSYFHYVYEHGLTWRDIGIVKLNYGKWQGTFIPTPLGYITNENDVSSMIRNIGHMPDNVLRSFFYHPRLEFNYIKINHDATGYPSYTYSDDSMLKRLVKAFRNDGYEFKRISDF